MKNVFSVYGNEQGYIKSFKTLLEARNFIKELKIVDKQENIEDIYLIYEEEE